MKRFLDFSYYKTVTGSYGLLHLVCRKCKTNEISTKLLCEDVSTPLNYYAAFNQFADNIPRNTIIVR